MKRPIINQVHQAYLQNFTRYLKVLGYAQPKEIARNLHEFFNRMEIEGKNISSITSQDLQNYYHYLQLRPNKRTGGALSLRTIDGYLFGLKLCFHYAHKTALIDHNPMSTLRFSHQIPEKRWAVAQPQIQELYAACQNEQESAIMSLFYGCGLRRKEAIDLDLRDIDMRKRWLYIRSGKGNKRRVIPLTASVSVAFKNYRYQMRPNQYTKQSRPEDKKAFMLSGHGQRMSGNCYWAYFKKILKRTDLPKEISLHHLRHSIATHLLAGGMSMETVRDFLGHDHLESTQIYTHIQIEQLK